MVTGINKTTDEDKIRALIDGWAKALRTKDVNGIMSHYAPDFVAFDLAPPLQHGADAFSKGLEDWFPTFEGPIGYEIRGLSISAGNDAAFSSSLNRMTGTKSSGEKMDLWVRATFGFRKIGDQWKIAHEHVSVPFHMDGSFRAAVDLRP
jgi:uncharacterized protein (TIGR02246 family)